ncbi:hypothetical protein [Geodermatophilus sp. SYSU D01105]
MTAAVAVVVLGDRWRLLPDRVAGVWPWSPDTLPSTAAQGRAGRRDSGSRLWLSPTPSAGAPIRALREIVDQP